MVINRIVAEELLNELSISVSPLMHCFLILDAQFKEFISEFALVHLDSINMLWPLSFGLKWDEGFDIVRKVVWAN
jgi:hypothetical protein